MRVQLAPVRLDQFGECMIIAATRRVEQLALV